MAKQTLYISKDVATGTEDCDTYVVPSGKTLEIVHMKGEAAFSPNSAVKLVWDWSGAGETVLWSIKGSSEIGADVTEGFPAMVGDGVKKIAVCLDNNEAGSVFMSGHVVMEVSD